MTGLSHEVFKNDENPLNNELRHPKYNKAVNNIGDFVYLLPPAKKKPLN